MTAKPSPLRSALIETAANMREGGLLSAASQEKITLRLKGDSPAPLAAPISAEDVRDLRRKARMSQSVFARALNVTTGYVSQLERGAKRPTGATLALLNLLRRTGVDAIR